MTDLEASIHGERILWSGKPDKKVFILETIFNSFFLISLLWSGLVALCIFISSKSDLDLVAWIALIVGMAFFLFPVWIYLALAITSGKNWDNTSYVITERGIYISGGVFQYDIQLKTFTEVLHINIHRGIFGKIFGVGSIEMIVPRNFQEINLGGYMVRQHDKNQKLFIIQAIPNYQEVFNLIKKMQTDVYADTMFPNDQRPEGNHGYNTEYMPEDKLNS